MKCPKCGHSGDESEFEDEEDEEDEEAGIRLAAWTRDWVNEEFGDNEYDQVDLEVVGRKVHFKANGSHVAAIGVLSPEILQELLPLGNCAAKTAKPDHDGVITVGDHLYTANAIAAALRNHGGTLRGESPRLFLWDERLVIVPDASNLACLVAPRVPDMPEKE